MRKKLLILLSLAALLASCGGTDVTKGILTTDALSRTITRGEDKKEVEVFFGTWGDGSTQFFELDQIKGFEFEEGYVCKLKVKLTSEVGGTMAEPTLITTYEMLKLIEKKKVE